MTLVEMLIALTLITVAVLGLLGELAADIRQQYTEKAQTTATHLASSTLESARKSRYSDLESLSHVGTQPASTQTINGVQFTTNETVSVCAATDSPLSCTTPADSTPTTVRANVTVTWTDNGHSHSVTMTRSIGDTTAKDITGGVSGLVGGSAPGNGTTGVVASLSLSPNSVSVNSSGRPSSAITATLSETGLSSSTTSVPLTWTDDNGAHQVTMTGSNGSFSITIPASSITKTAASSGSSVTFAATVPGTRSVPTASLAVTNLPAFSGNCTITVAPIVLRTLTRNTLNTETLACSTTGLTSSDSVTVSYLSGNSPRSVSLNASGGGSSWSVTLPANSAMASTGVSESFTFTLTRTSDNATASQSQTAVLA